MVINTQGIPSCRQIADINVADESTTANCTTFRIAELKDFMAVELLVAVDKFCGWIGKDLVGCFGLILYCRISQALDHREDIQLAVAPTIVAFGANLAGKIILTSMFDHDVFDFVCRQGWIGFQQ